MFKSLELSRGWLIEYEFQNDKGEKMLKRNVCTQRKRLWTWQPH